MLSLGKLSETSAAHAAVDAASGDTSNETEPTSLTTTGPKNAEFGLRSYSLYALVRLAADVLKTRLFYPRARLLRSPVFIRGRAFTNLGRSLTTGPGFRIDAFPFHPSSGPVVIIGDGVQINDYVHLSARLSVSIGDRAMIASRVFIGDHNHGVYSGPGEHTDPRVPPQLREDWAAPVRIEEDVWIGEGVAVLPGVTIGRGAVIGAMSVVTRDVPPYSIAVGNPARVVKRYDAVSKQWIAV